MKHLGEELLTQRNIALLDNKEILRNLFTVFLIFK